MRSSESRLISAGAPEGVIWATWPRGTITGDSVRGFIVAVAIGILPRSSNEVRYSGATRTTTSCVSPEASSNVVAVWPESTVRRVFEIEPTDRPTFVARSRLTRTTYSGLCPSRLDFRSTSPGTSRIAASIRSFRSWRRVMSGPRMLTWTGSWPPAMPPASMMPVLTPLNTGSTRRSATWNADWLRLRSPFGFIRT